MKTAFHPWMLLVVVMLLSVSGVYASVIVPNDAANRNVTWSGNQESMALIDGDGKVYASRAGEAETSAWSDYGRLYVTSPVKEVIEVYALTGVIVHRATKQPGETVFDLNVPRGIVIVKGSSGWVRKVKL